MGDEEATRVCGRCHKEVAEVNFALHETHCSRFLCLCPDCDENVPRSELQKHREEQHSQVRCSKCHKKMERRHLPEHEEEECPERLVCCQFCELEMPWKDLQEHAVACGSRTELCPDCQRYIKLTDKEDHGKTCSGQDLYSDPSPPQGAYGPPVKPKVKMLKCKVCLMSFPAEEIKKHEMTCTAPKSEESESDSDSDNSEKFSDFSEFLPSRLRNMYQDLPRPNGPSGGAFWAKPMDPNELSTCPNCQLVLPRITLRWHEGKCRLHTFLKKREAVASDFV